MHERPHWLVAYDIAERRRLLKVHRHLAASALPLQKSLFLVQLDDSQARRLHAELVQLIDAQADDLRMYRLPSRQAIVSLGQGTLVDNGLFVP